MNTDAQATSRSEYIIEDDVVPKGWRWTLPRALGILAFLAMAAFWIWAFNNRDSIAHPDEFDDPTFVAEAESLCSVRQAAIAELPLATAVNNPEERSVIVTLATRELDAMVNELGQLTPPTDLQGAEGVRRWLVDYQLFLDDRRGYADILATGEDPAFLISGTEDGVRVTDLLTTFAEVNNMASCAPSPDL